MSFRNTLGAACLVFSSVSAAWAAPLTAPIMYNFHSGFADGTTVNGSFTLEVLGSPDEMVANGDVAMWRNTGAINPISRWQFTFHPGTSYPPGGIDFSYDSDTYGAASNYWQSSYGDSEVQFFEAGMQFGIQLWFRGAHADFQVEDALNVAGVDMGASAILGGQNITELTVTEASSSVPEPSTGLLGGLGMIAVMYAKRKSLAQQRRG